MTDAEKIKALTESLENLLNWGRENTSPAEETSPHKLLINACETLKKINPDWNPR
jgi:hypothetical protein